MFTFEFFFPSYTQNQNQININQKIGVVTIPLAICQANKNSRFVEKFSSSSLRCSSRFSIERDIEEAWLFPGDADVLVSNSLSVTLNCPF